MFINNGYINNFIYIKQNAKINNVNKVINNVNFNFVAKIPSYQIYFNDNNNLYAVESSTLLVLLDCDNNNANILKGKERYVNNFRDNVENYIYSRRHIAENNIKQNEIELIGNPEFIDNGLSYDYLSYYDCVDYGKDISLQEFLDAHKDDKLKIKIEVIK